MLCDTLAGLLVLSFASTPFACLVAAVALGLGNGMSNGWIQTVGADLAPPGHRPQFLGMWNLLMGVGSTIGPLWCGLFVQWRSIDTAAWASAIATAVGATWYALLGAETLVRDEPMVHHSVLAPPVVKQTSPAIKPGAPSAASKPPMGSKPPMV